MQFRLAVSILCSLFLFALSGCDDEGSAQAAEPAGDEKEEVKEEAKEEAEEAGSAAAQAKQFEKRLKVLWERLAPFEKDYLQRWGTLFSMGWASEAAPNMPTPCDVADAWNDLAYAMTGPDGLWRTTIPGAWLKCQENAESNPCQMLMAHQEVFVEWDAFQERIARLEPRRAGSFVMKHIEEMEIYMDTYVLASGDDKGMRATKFFKEQLN